MTNTDTFKGFKTAGTHSIINICHSASPKIIITSPTFLLPTSNTWKISEHSGEVRQ